MGEVVAEDKSQETFKDAEGNEVPEEALVVGPTPRSFAVPGNDLTGYIGVAPEYMTYADPSHKPLLTEEEAYLYTNLTDEDIEATRNRQMPDGVEMAKNEAPAVVESAKPGSGVRVAPTGAGTRYATAESVTMDPVAGPQHPAILSDEEEERIAEAEKEKNSEGQDSSKNDSENSDKGDSDKSQASSVPQRRLG